MSVVAVLRQRLRPKLPTCLSKPLQGLLNDRN